MYTEPCHRLTCTIKKYGIVCAAPGHESRQDGRAVGHSGHIRVLFPLPSMRTDAGSPSRKRPTVSFVTSTARAVVYEKEQGIVAYAHDAGDLRVDGLLDVDMKLL